MRILFAAALALLIVASAVTADSTNDAACSRLQSLTGWSVKALAGASLPAGYCASVWRTGGLGKPRGMVVLPNSNGLLYVDAGNSGSIQWLNDTNGSGSVEDADSERKRIVSGVTGLSHGIALWRGKLMASANDRVYIWNDFDASKPSTVLSTPALAVKNIPTGSHHTRSLAVDKQNRLYVQHGSDGNIDPDPAHCMIRRFRLDQLPSGGFDWSSGEIFARGLRNEVGLAFDRHGVLFGVENGADELDREDLGGYSAHLDNPAEEINVFDGAVGAFYGYPYCFSEYALKQGVGLGAGTQWAWPDFLKDGTHDDAWCRNRSNVLPPRLVMRAHTAPLGLAFYEHDRWNTSDRSNTPFAFPGDAQGREYLYVAQHGSWNTPTPVGYSIQRFPLKPDDGSRTEFVGSTEEFLRFSGPGSADDASWLRPVDVAVGPKGEMYLSNDREGSASIVVIRFAGVDGALSSPGGDPSSGPSTDPSTDPSTGSSSSANSASTLKSFALPLLAIFLSVVLAVYQV